MKERPDVTSGVEVEMAIETSIKVFVRPSPIEGTPITTGHNGGIALGSGQVTAAIAEVTKRYPDVNFSIEVKGHVVIFRSDVKERLHGQGEKRAHNFISSPRREVQP